MDETSTHMRRSFSMPVKPLHLEQKTLKRSSEKENVYATDDDTDSEDNCDANQLRQCSSPALVTENSFIANEPESQHGLTKHIRSIRDFLVSSVSPIFAFFRKTPTTTYTRETCPTINIIDSNGHVNACSEFPIQQFSSNGSDSDSASDTSSRVDSSNKNFTNQTETNKSNELKKSNESEIERVVFSL